MVVKAVDKFRRLVDRIVVCGTAYTGKGNEAVDSVCIGLDWMEQLDKYAVEQQVNVYAGREQDTHEFRFVRAIGRSDHWKRVLEELQTKWAGQDMRFASVFIDPADHFVGAPNSVFHEGVHIGPDTTIGDHCILNTRCIIEHDVTIGKGTFIGPGAIVLGRATVGEFCFIGAGAIIAPGITLADGTFVKAGRLKWGA